MYMVHVMRTYVYAYRTRHTVHRLQRAYAHIPTTIPYSYNTYIVSLHTLIRIVCTHDMHCVCDI